MVSNETICRWVLKFEPIMARNLREIRPKPHSRSHFDEIVYICGALLTAKARILELLVQPQRDKAAALRLLRTLLRRQGFILTTIVTDKMRSYGTALREIGFSGLHEQGLRASRFDDANEKCKVSNQPSQISALLLSVLPFTPAVFRSSDGLVPTDGQTLRSCSDRVAESPPPETMCHPRTACPLRKRRA
jgi:hypothetical protein